MPFRDTMFNPNPMLMKMTNDNRRFFLGMAVAFFVMQLTQYLFEFGLHFSWKGVVAVLISWGVGVGILLLLMKLPWFPKSRKNKGEAVASESAK